MNSTHNERNDGVKHEIIMSSLSPFVVTVVKITGNLSYMERGRHYSFPFRKFKIRK